MTYKSGNPALGEKTFDVASNTSGSVMTLQSTALKTLFLLVLCVGSGAIGWNLVANSPELFSAVVFPAIFVALGIGLLATFFKKSAIITAPLYAILEGFALGGLSQLFERQFENIVLQAVLLTGAIFLAMLLLYLFKIIKPTENLKMGIAAATIGVGLYYLAHLILSFFGVELPLINDNSWLGIAFTVVVIIIAALNLVVDFDFIEQGVEKRAPKYMEWYAGFGLLVTVVWLYLELLRLLGKIRS